MQVRNVTNETAVTLVQASLHKGEPEAIVLAAELHAERLVTTRMRGDSLIAVASRSFVWYIRVSRPQI
jgi:predicted nucleic acid-binding protein